MNERSSIILKSAGVISIIAGAILILTGYTTHSLVLTILDFVISHFSSSLSSFELFLLRLATTFFNFLVALGGVVIIAGGVILFTGHRSLGRVLIWLGGGMGILGLLFTMGEAFYYSHFSLLVFHGEYWMGLILATAASLLAKKG